MMDPITIGTAAAIANGLFSASAALHAFIRNTKNVDQTVQDLVTEVDSLGRVLGEVETVLRSPMITRVEGEEYANESKQLWTTVNGSLEECQVTVTRLDSVLDSVRKKQTQPSWVTQAFRQVKLSLRQEEIAAFRVQIHTHSDALKTALIMINMLVRRLTAVVFSSNLDINQKSYILGPSGDQRRSGSQN